MPQAVLKEAFPAMNEQPYGGSEDQQIYYDDKKRKLGYSWSVDRIFASWRDCIGYMDFREANRALGEVVCLPYPTKYMMNIPHSMAHC